MSNDRIFNADFAKSDERFISACYSVGIKPSARQAGKYRRGQGIAYRVATRRANAEAMTCKALRAALGLKASDKTRKAALIDLYLNQ